MRPIVARWLLQRRLFPVCEVFTGHMCDFVGVRFGNRTTRKIPPIEKVVAVELKLYDLREVCRQARNNQFHCDESWAILPGDRLDVVRSQTLDNFRIFGIGLARIDEDKVSTVLDARDTGYRWRERSIATLWGRAKYEDLRSHKCMEQFEEIPHDFGYQRAP